MKILILYQNKIIFCMILNRLYNNFYIFTPLSQQPTK